MEHRLRYLGFKTSAINWFISYLENRLQSIKIGRTVSDPMMVSCGIPQGSILGQLLFVMYVNDFPLHMTKTTLYLYADDMALVASGSSVSEIEMKLNHDLSTAKKWLEANKLSLNVLKTKVMLFSHPRNPNLNTGNLSIKLDDTTIEQVSIFKYLGIHLDRNLSFQEHCDVYCKWVDQHIAASWRSDSHGSDNHEKASLSPAISIGQ